jgi:DNA invertase Pin-like site-specific DNA recombinase
MTRPGILIGYSRTSTTDQLAGLEAQVRDLKAAGCTKLFQEQVSSVVERAQLAAALDYAREGDTLVVSKLDRLARSARHLLEIVDALEKKGVALRILNLGGDTVDTSGATGRLILNLAEGKCVSEIAQSLGIGRASVYRAIGNRRRHATKAVNHIGTPQ